MTIINLNATGDKGKDAANQRRMDTDWKNHDGSSNSSLNHTGSSLLHCDRKII